jgi:hypothetical protein
VQAENHNIFFQVIMETNPEAEAEAVGEVERGEEGDKQKEMDKLGTFVAVSDRENNKGVDDEVDSEVAEKTTKRQRNEEDGPSIQKTKKKRSPRGIPQCSTYLATACKNGRSRNASCCVRLWNADTYEPLHDFEIPFQVKCLKFNSSNLILVCGNGANVSIFSLETKKCVAHFYAGRSVADLCFSHDEELLAVFCEGNYVTFWKWKQAERLGVVDCSPFLYRGSNTAPPASPVPGISITYDYYPRMVTLREDAPGKVMDLLISKDFRKQCLNADRTILAAFDQMIISLWSLASSTIIGKLKHHIGEINGVCFSNDGLRLASCAQDCSICIWCISDAKLLIVIKCEHSVLYVSFDPTGAILAGVCRTTRRYSLYDLDYVLFDQMTGEMIRTLPGPGLNDRFCFSFPNSWVVLM